jgi:hypothetical protein
MAVYKTIKYHPLEYTSRTEEHTPEVVQRIQRNLSRLNQLQRINQHILHRYSPHPVNLNSSDHYATYEEIFINSSYAYHYRTFEKFNLSIMHVDYAYYLATTLIDDDMIQAIREHQITCHVFANDGEWICQNL